MYQKELEVAQDIARQAGVIMKKYFFAKDQGAHSKADGSPVTKADTEVNTLVIAELAKHFDDGLIGEEESTTDYGMGRKWFCDPVDGTKAFTWGLPTAMISLALVVDGQPAMGVAYDPFLDLMYTGIKGQGSFCNDERLEVSTAGLEDSHVALSSTLRKFEHNLPLFTELADKGAKIITFSGAVYKSCLIARGRLVGYMEPGVSGHDMAAVQVIVEEAGGEVTGLDGKRFDYSKPFQGAIVSNKVNHQAFVDLMAKHNFVV